jgi:hypothetical protein
LIASRSGSSLADRRDSHREFLVSINAKQSAACRLIVGRYRAGSGTKSGTRQVKILTNVPGVDGNDLVGRQIAASFHSCGNRCPKERCSGGGHEPLL